MHSRERTHAGHTARFSVVPSATGWEVREELDSRLVRRLELSDWHRVERAMHAFEAAAVGQGVLAPDVREPTSRTPPHSTKR